MSYIENGYILRFVHYFIYYPVLPHPNTIQMFSAEQFLRVGPKGHLCKLLNLLEYIRKPVCWHFL